MSLVTITCAFCKATCEKEAGGVNRARRIGAALYCGKRCSGLGRRNGKTKAQLVAEKAAYDRAFRAKNLDRIKAEKREYFKRTYDPAVAREYRKNRTFDHSAYCRRYYADPAKKQEKVEYDIRLRGAAYAEFFEAWRLLIELEREIRTRCPDKYERAKARGYFTRTQERKRHDRQVRQYA